MWKAQLVGERWAIINNFSYIIALSDSKEDALEIARALNLQLVARDFLY